MHDLASRLRSLRYFASAPPPNLAADYVMFDCSKKADADAAAERYGIMASSHNAGNALFIHREARRLRYQTPCNFHGSSNVAIIDRDCGFHGALHFTGHRNLVVLHGGQGELALDATLYSDDTLVWGRGASAWGVRIWVQGGTVCTVCDGCLLSENISMRTTDHHSIIDLDTWSQINKPADITVGRHVWIGPNVRIGKGVEIGEGSILAPDSVVSASIPKTELWGGIPARMIRKNVSWVISHPADANDVAALRELLR